MIDFDITIENKAEIKKYLDDMPETMFVDAKKAFQDSALKMQKQVKLNATNKIKVRSGALKRSIRTSTTGTNLATLKGSLYAASKVGAVEIVYAPVHEYGATIKAIDKYRFVTGGPFLNIPTQENKTPTGVMRQTSTMVFANGGYVAGKGVFNSDGVKMFYLTKQVTIPARLGMNDAVNDEIPTLLSTLVGLIGEE